VRLLVVHSKGLNVHRGKEREQRDEKSGRGASGEEHLKHREVLHQHLPNDDLPPDTVRPTRRKKEADDKWAE
jgi:hypothetical protein